MKRIGEILNDALYAKGYKSVTPCELMRAARAFFNQHANRGGFLDDIPELADFHKTVQQYKVDPEKMNNRVMLTLHQRADVYGAPLELREFSRLFMSALRKRDIPVYVHSCWRSPELQQKLYSEGKTTLRSGAHQRSAAVDIVHGYFHWRLDPDMWRYMGLIGEHIIRQNAFKIEWGGRWSTFPDPAHWQMKNWKEIPVIPDDHQPKTFQPFAKATRYV